MSVITPDNPDPRERNRLPLIERLIYAIPILGWMLKDVVHGDSDNIWYFLATLFCLWVLSAMTWGYPGIIVPALIAVPLVFVGLVLLTRG